MANDNSLRIGTFLKSRTYRVEDVIGSGGFGVTYRATHVELGRLVAIKEFFISEFCVRDEGGTDISVAVTHNVPVVENFKRKFLQEARMVARLDNRHIINVFDIFEENGTAYYVMDYLQGGSLEDKVNTGGAISENEVRRIVSQLCNAISYIHGQKILHLDVKPSNIMIDGDGDIVLIDFGISKQYEDDDSRHSTYAATFSKSYAPIEQYEKGGVSHFVPALDVYSFGATIYFLITGNQPPTAFELLKHGALTVPGASKELAAAITAAMQPLQKDRLQSVAEFQDMLEGRNISAGKALDKRKKNSRDDSRTIIDVSGRGAVGAFEELYETPDNAMRRKGGKSVYIVMIVLLVVALAGAGAYFLFVASPVDDTIPTVAVEDTSGGIGDVPEEELVESNETNLIPNRVGQTETASPVDTLSVKPVSQADTESVAVVESEKPQEGGSSNSGRKPQGNRPKPDKKDNKNNAADGIRYASNGNYKKAVPLLRQAADNGDAQAQNLLGECYQKGNGVDINYVKAVSYYRKAAEQGNADAQFNLSICYSRGIGGLSKDMRQAFNYCNRAANQGHASAQYNMGEFYRIGDVVPIDRAVAIGWYRKAAAQGNEHAKEKLMLMETGW